jgi:hypothetical protein
MAENKTSFILYSDQKSTIDLLSDEQAGKLLKHIYAYVNDENPILDSLELKLVFEPIRLQFKRDLKKWENTKEQKSTAGIMGNLKRYHSDLYEAVQSNTMQLSEAQKVAEDRRNSHSDTELAVNVNDTVTVNVNDNVNEIIDKRFSFRKSLCEYGIEKHLVDDFLKNRKLKKLANTKTAFDNLVLEFQKTNMDVNELMLDLISRGWGSFKNSWLQKEKSNQPETGTVESIRQRLIDAGAYE